MKLTILLTGVSLLVSNAWAGNLSNVPGTLDTTVVDPAPALYPHFICASGCSSGFGGGSVTQAGAWTVGISNFPAIQAISGSVSVAGMATAANQPALNADGGGLSHITNFPAIQPVNGTVNVANLPATQAVSGAVSVINLPATQSVTGIVSVGNFPVTQVVTGSVAVPGVATAANQPSLDPDGGEHSHVTNWPTTQSISGSINVLNLPSVQAVSGTVQVSGGALAANQPAMNADGGGLAHITNFPATQIVAGTLSVSNFPPVQPVSGSVIIPGVATAVNQPQINSDGGGLAHITNLPVTQTVSGSASNSASGQAPSAVNLPTMAYLYGWNGAGWDQIRDDANRYIYADVVGSTGNSLTQGTGNASASSLNIFEGGGVGIGAPSTSTQAIVRYEVQTTPAGVPVDPTLPSVSTSINGSGAVTTANTFQALLISSGTRKGCAFQNTSVDIEYIDVADSTGSATKARSYQVPPSSYWYCSQTSGLVISDLINVTAPTSGDTFVLTSQ